jgi:hypothetical protein
VPLCKQLKKELEILIRERQDNRGGPIPSILGRFNLKEPVKDLKLNTIVNNVERLALTL